MKYIDKKDLKVGKWYGNTQWKTNSFAKFLNKISHENKIRCSEYYYNSYKNIICAWSSNDKFFEIPLETLKKYLPKDHPDLQLNNNDYEIY